MIGKKERQLKERSNENDQRLMSRRRVLAFLGVGVLAPLK